MNLTRLKNLLPQSMDHHLDTSIRDKRLEDPIQTKVHHLYISLHFQEIKRFQSVNPVPSYEKVNVRI